MGAKGQWEKSVKSALSKVNEAISDLISEAARLAEFENKEVKLSLKLEATKKFAIQYNDLIDEHMNTLESIKAKELKEE